MSDDIRPASPTLTDLLRGGESQDRLAYFMQVFSHANAWAIKTQGEQAQNIINANEYIKNGLLSGHVGLCETCQEPTNELFFEMNEGEPSCVWCIQETNKTKTEENDRIPPMTSFIHTLTNDQQTAVRQALEDCGELEHDQINDALEGRLSDLADTLQVSCFREILNLQQVALGGFLCVCADCGEVVPEWEEDPHHNGLKDCAHPLGLWADCPTCDITGVEFDSHDLLPIHGGQGTNCDYQFTLRHFGESYQPTVEEFVACLREEVA